MSSRGGRTYNGGGTYLNNSNTSVAFLFKFTHDLTTIEEWKAAMIKWNHTVITIVKFPKLLGRQAGLDYLTANGITYDPDPRTVYPVPYWGF